jgi:hypothetical protein
MAEGRLLHGDNQKKLLAAVRRATACTWSNRAQEEKEEGELQGVVTSEYLADVAPDANRPAHEL